MANKYKRLAKNSFWTLIGNTGSKLMGFLLLPLYTRWLGTAGFGESDLVTTYSSFLVSIMTMCVADGIFAFTKNESKDVKKIFFSSALSFVFVVLALWAVAWGILDFAFSALEMKNSFADNLWFIYGIVVTTFIQQYSQQFILSTEKIKIYSFTGIVHSMLTLLFSYWMIPLMGVKGYIMAMIYANLLTGAYSFLFSKSYNYISFGVFDMSRVKDLLKYSIPLIPNGVMWWLVSALNRPVMEYNLDYSSIGIFAVANRFPSVLTMVYAVFSAAWNISVFEEYGKEGYEDFYKKTFRLLFLVIVIVASLFIISSELIVKIFAAPAFHEAWKYMVVLIIGSVFSCLSAFLGANFGVVKQSKYFFYSSVWGAVTAVVLNFILIPLLGLWGSSISVLMSFVVMSMSRYAYSKRYVCSSLLQYVRMYIVALAIVAISSLFIESIILKIVLAIIVITGLQIMEREVLLPIIYAIRERLSNR